MFRKIVTYIGWVVLIGLFGTYFYFASTLKVKGKGVSEENMCREIQVVILDSAINRFVSKEEVKDIISSSNYPAIDKEIKDINPYILEELLKESSAIKNSEVSIDRDGVLHIDITQRRPVLRIQKADGGFYVDESKYIFPLGDSYTSYVPIVTGHIPLELKKGKVDKKGEEWLSNMMELGNFIEKHDFWRSQIQQIDILPNGDISLYTRVGDQTIILGGIDGLKYKLSKLEAFYYNIVPLKGWNRYSTINLKYSNQVVCTIKESEK